MTTTIMVASQNGRLLVQESKLAPTNYTSGGLLFRIGGVKKVEQLISITNDFNSKGLVINPDEVLISNDILIVPMRRADIGMLAYLNGATSGAAPLSGGAINPNMSGIFASGDAYMGQLNQLNSGGAISGRVTVTANVIAR